MLGGYLFFAYVVASSAIFTAWALLVASMTQGQPAQHALSLGFVALSLAMGFLNCVAGFFYAKSKSLPGQRRHPPAPARLPAVSVVVASCNENLSVLKTTLASLRKIAYPRSKISFWIADSTENVLDRNKIKAVSKSLGYRYSYHPRRRGFKAGSLNRVLSRINSEFFCVFDADEELVDRAFLAENVGWFSADPQLAFVQTAKASRKAGFFEDAAEATNALFSNVQQPLRSELGMALYSGSAAILRASAFCKLGGFNEDPSSPSEDAEFSLRADIAGYRGIYVNKAYALGVPVSSYSSFARQQWKYSYGSARLLGTYLRNARRIGPSLDKHLHYLSQIVGFPFTSLLVILFSFLSAAFVLSNLGFAFVSLSDALAKYSSAAVILREFQPLIANVINILVLTRVYFGSFSLGIMGGLISLSLTFKRTEAALSAQFRRLSEIPLTVKSRSRGSPLFAVKFGKVEFAYAAFFSALCAFSLLRGDIIGAVWMSWYAGMFGLTVILAMIYG